MAVSALLINFSEFQLVHWIVFGVCALLALIVFCIGCKKGFSNLSLRPISWAFGCTVFVFLEIFLHDKCFIAGMLGDTDPALVHFASSITWLVVALVARWVVFGGLYVMIKCSQKAKLAKAAAINRAEKEGAEEILSDENKVYKALPLAGKIKPGPLNRLFGGIFCLANVFIVLGAVVAFAMVVLNVTPLYDKVTWLYTGDMEKIWGYLRTWTLDFLMIALLCAIVIKGYKEGLLNGVRTLGITLLKLAAIVFGLALPFLPMAAEGATFGFLSVGATKLTELIPLEGALAMLANILPVVFKVIFGVLIAIVLHLIVKLIGWLLGKLLDVVDSVDALWRIDGVIGAIVYAVIAIVVVAAIGVILYVLEYYGVFVSSQLFSANSPIMGGMFEVFDVSLRPLLEKAALFFA